MQLSMKLHQDAFQPRRGKRYSGEKRSSHLSPGDEKALGFKMWNFSKKEKQCNHTSVQEYSTFCHKFTEENVKVMTPQQNWVTELGLASTENWTGVKDTSPSLHFQDTSS